MIVIIISFILDNIISNLINYYSIFYPLFTLLSLVLIYPHFNKKSKKYFICTFIFGFIYDISVTDTLFLNAFIFLLLAYLLKYTFNKLTYNYLSVLLLSLGAIIYYRAVNFLILVVINYLSFNIGLLFKSIYCSIILNVIYISVYYLINSKRLIFKRR